MYDKGYIPVHPLLAISIEHSDPLIIVCKPRDTLRASNCYTQTSFQKSLISVTFHSI